MLHDAVEDQGGEETSLKIRQVFGDKVAEVINECTDSWVEPKPPWRERKEKYIASIPSKSNSAKLVSLADKIHNARSILFDYRLVGESLWDRFTGKKEGTLWYYRSIADTFRASFDHPLVDELERTVAEIEEITHLLNP